MTTRTRTTDDVIAALATRQSGLVTRTQLLASGLSGHTVDSRVKAGRLRLVWRGVYQVGPLAMPRSRGMAAVLACGPNAVLSHRSAAARGIFCRRHRPDQRRWT